MTPIELYWPSEMLAQVFPEEYGHLAIGRRPTPQAPEPEPARYTAEVVAGGCVVFWLSRGEHEGSVTPLK